ncbi:MAG: MATE family efflux transporter [Chloroflexota bacterium]|nr:MATE family efflux transporter [Chloroflexota bacterium]
MQPQDSQIFRLALPALGSLAAGPLYVLVDTAIVGHLGTEPLAGLALAGTLLDGVLALSNFLAYATTAQAGRQHAAGQIEATKRLAAQALWLAAGLGLGMVVLGLAGGAAAVGLLGGSGSVANLAALYLRIGVLGLPFALIATAGQGFLRGMEDLRTPLVFIGGGNVANVVLEVVFVYAFGWGLAGSAWATVIAQAGMGAGFILELWTASRGVRVPTLQAMRPLLRMGGQIFVRTAALYSAFIVASAVLARIGAASLAAHQVLFQLWMFLALTLDAIAIAGQVMVSRALGRGDREEAAVAAARMIGWSAVVGLACAALMLAFRDVLPRAFTSDPAVLDRARVAWPVFALMQPLNGAVFALDGILIGAGDSRYLMWSMLASAAVVVPLALLALFTGSGIVGVWLAILALIVVRLATTGKRFLDRRWLVTGSLAIMGKLADPS